MKEASVLDEVFSRFLNRIGVFKDREVLRHDYLPERLPHREDQIKRLGETVAPVLKEARCSNIFVYGKTGTGKTAVTKYVLTRLEAKAREFGAPVSFCYVNCRLAGTEYRILASVCNSIQLSVPFTGLSVGEVFERFKKALNAAKKIMIIALDEVDVLVKSRSDALLYELTRINEALSQSKVSIIGISNDLRLKEFLDPRVLSSLSEEEIVFRPYDAEELRDILAERAQMAFRDGALSEGALRLCAALAAAEHGDARRALDLLRVAGEVAERKGADIVTEEHIREAEKLIEHNRVIEALANLTLHSKLVILSVFQLVRANGYRAVTGEIYEVYNELCGELALTPLTQRRVSTLVNELDALGLLNAQVVSMGRYGRTKKIRLEVTRTLIREAFSNDNRLGRLIDYEPKCLSKDARCRN
ncbi:MAG: ORC1-type DNA replication protein [Candidatus Bathyarchaeota archaeon]|jgi:cell division control protein 6|nr:ORC1-type DNA replication protein [Candidatus Bathyarchaeota archaeon A05DMB-3]MDH7606344.1 ORC1-type DNA replication protein [Candidatus Bathyarchaeota archaeon]